MLATIGECKTTLERGASEAINSEFSPAVRHIPARRFARRWRCFLHYLYCPFIFIWKCHKHPKQECERSYPLSLPRGSLTPRGVSAPRSLARGNAAFREHIASIHVSFPTPTQPFLPLCPTKRWQTCLQRMDHWLLHQVRYSIPNIGRILSGFHGIPRKWSSWTDDWLTRILLFSSIPSKRIMYGWKSRINLFLLLYFVVANHLR